MANIVNNVPLWSVTIWDKSFNGIDRAWQPKTIRYKYLLSDELDRLNIGGTVRLLYTGQDTGFTTEELAGDALCEGEIVSIPWGGTPSVKYYKGKFVTGDNRIATSSKPGELLNKYLYYYMRGHLREIASYYRGAGLKHPAMKDVLKMTISYPCIEDQEEIIKQFESLEMIINLRQQELQKFDNLIKARFVELFGDPEHNNKGWPVKKLNDLCNVGSSKRIYQEEQTMEGVPFWRISDLVAKMDTGNVECNLYIPESKYEELKAQGLVPKPGDILVTSRGTLGRCYIISPDDRFYFQDGMISWLSRYVDEITPLYIQYLFDLPGFRKQIDSMQAGSTVAYLSIAMLKKLNVMLPNREVQKEFSSFVAQVDKSKLRKKLNYITKNRLAS